MKKTIYKICAALTLTLAVSSCSDNYNDVYEPNKTTKTLVLTSESQFFSDSDDKLNLNAGSTSTDIMVESNTRWKVEVLNCDGGWCDVSAFNGSGNGNFSINVRENMGDSRNCIVRVSKIDAEGNEINDENETNRSLDITVVQEGSNVRISPSSVESFASQDAKTQEFDIVSNVAWTLTTSYENSSTPHFITITPLEGMTEDSEDTFSGNGNAKFRISLLNNGSNADRKGYITLSSEIGNYSVEITQLKSEYTIYVTPGEVNRISPDGGEINFGVLSLSDWNVASAAEAEGWLTISPKSGIGSMTDPVTVTAVVAPNTSGYRRSAVINFIPTDSNYQTYSVNIEQNGYDLTFSASPDEGTLGVVLTDGETKNFTLDSRFNWEISAPDWIRADRSEGSASDNPQTVSLTVMANDSGATRTGNVTIRPLTTTFSGGVSLAPENVNVDPIQFSITQFGGREPAISVPWLRDGYTQSSATVEFNFYSPFYPATAAGIEWRKATDNQWIDVPVSFDNEKIDYTVSVELTNLDAATEYVARGYVIYSDGQKKYGTTSMPFTTAGIRPGANDNPTPGI